MKIDTITSLVIITLFLIQYGNFFLPLNEISGNPKMKKVEGDFPLWKRELKFWALVPGLSTSSSASSWAASEQIWKLVWKPEDEMFSNIPSGATISWLSYNSTTTL